MHVLQPYDNNASALNTESICASPDLALSKSHRFQRRKSGTTPHTLGISYSMHARELKALNTHLSCAMYALPRLERRGGCQYHARLIFHHWCRKGKAGVQTSRKPHTAVHYYSISVVTVLKWQQQR